ncbi:MAG: hypothetical protein HYY93_12940 [Planctomycetes bacterium]|nr:hypothetical protein [Planctomycetota bacterium]
MSCLASFDRLQALVLLAILLCPVRPARAQDSASVDDWRLDRQDRRDPFDPVKEAGIGDPHPDRLSAEQAASILRDARQDLSTLGFILSRTKRTLDEDLDRGRLFERIAAGQARLVEGKAPEEALTQIGEILNKARAWWTPIDARETQLRVLESKARESLEEARGAYNQGLIDAVYDLAAEAEVVARTLPADASSEEAARVQAVTDRLTALQREAGQFAVAHLGIGERLTGIIYSLRDEEIPVRIGIEFLGRPAAAETTVRICRPEAQAIFTGPTGTITGREGDTLPEWLSGLSIRRIEQDRVILLYRGEEVAVKMR